MKKKLCLFAALILSLASVGCRKVQARIDIKEGNKAYLAENYKDALSYYSHARSIDQSFPELDRLIAYSQIGLYVPDDKTPENEKHANAAITELSKYLKKRPEDRIARDALIG